MSHFLTMADAADAGAPECFSEEFAYLERTGGLVDSGPGVPAYDPDPDDYYYDDRDDYEPSEPDDPDDGQSAPDPLPTPALWSAPTDDCPF